MFAQSFPEQKRDTMSIRVKLLLILLAISIVPMVLLRVNGSRTLEDMGSELARQARQNQVHTAELELERMVQDNARILSRDGKLMHLSLLYIVSRAEAALAGSADRDDPPALLALPNDSNGTEYCVRRYGEECLPLDVDMNAARLITPMHGFDTLNARKILRNVTPAMHRIKKVLPQLVLWIRLRMNSGGLALYPAFSDQSLPKRHGMRHKGMRMQAHFPENKTKGISWSYPYIDAITGKVVFTLAAPFRAPDGKIAGNIMIDMPVNSMLHQNSLLKKRAPGVESMLIRLNHEQSNVEIVAKEDMKAPRHMRWVAIEELELLQSSNSTLFDEFKIKLAKRKSGVTILPYKGKQSLWAYSPVGSASYLLLALPMTDIVAQADKAQEYVMNRVDTQIRNTGIILAVTIVLVTLLGFFVSERFTNGIRAVADAARRLASGDLQARCNIHRRDEIGDMGAAFDTMVPALEDHLRIKQDLSIAQEVQQNLLPPATLAMDGLEAAARIIYCDETGGDFFDYIPMCDDAECPASSGIAVAVGDVSGHGVPSALLMSSARAFLRARRMMPGTAADVVGAVNNLVASDTYETGQFVTMFYAEILPAERTIRYVRAGHDPAVLVLPVQPHAAGQEPGSEQTPDIQELNAGGPSLGLLEDSPFVEQDVETLPAGTVLAIGTDGIWEARSEQGTMYGKERFTDLVRRHADKSAAEILDLFYADHAVFRGNTPQEDDITLLVVKLI